MASQRLDIEIARRGLAQSRSQAENLIRLGRVKVNDRVAKKAGMMVGQTTNIEVEQERYVSRAGLKLSSVAVALNLDFRGRTVLDVGSSTGGFTDYALQHGATKVIAVDVGSEQLHPTLRVDERVELYEKTDIRDLKELSSPVDIVVMDLSFISLRQVLPSVAQLVGPKAQIVAMMKPQFEAGADAKYKGVVKNDTLRRRIIKDFEAWLTTNRYLVVAKADSEVTGAKGNRERFYLLTKH